MPGGNEAAVKVAGGGSPLQGPARDQMQRARRATAVPQA